MTGSAGIIELPLTMQMTTDIETLLQRVSDAATPALDDLVRLLSVTDPAACEKIYACADAVRKQRMGEGILLRGIVEFSNVCDNTCHYCGLNKHNSNLLRYTLSQEEIIEAVGRIVSHNIKTVVLQSGESDSLDPQWFAGVIREIKKRFDLSVTLSVGEKSRETYKLWKDAGADR